jgi:hypothetical protein
LGAVGGDRQSEDEPEQEQAGCDGRAHLSTVRCSVAAGQSSFVMTGGGSEVLQRSRLDGPVL